MGKRRCSVPRKIRLPTPLRSCTPQPPQPLGCGPLLRETPPQRQLAAADHGCDDAEAQRGTKKFAASFNRKTDGCACSSRELAAARGSWRFEVPTALARRTAVGSNSGIPFILQRVLRFSEVWFEPIPEPRPRDWLSLHPELMQTFDAFRIAFGDSKGKMGPSPERQCLHLLPLGPGQPDPDLFSRLRDICAAFFYPLRVAVVRLPGDAPVPGPDGEINADEVLAWMSAGLRANSALMVALTEAPLRSGGSLTIGASDWAARVCVCSIEKYVPTHATVLDEPLPILPPESPSTVAAVASHLRQFAIKPNAEDLPIVFERITKLILHEAVHMFGVLHCCYYRCLMNGSSTLEEVDSKPPYLCGMCLKKLQLVLGFDPLERYVKLAKSWGAAKREDISRWYMTRVALVQTTLASCRGQPPGALAWKRSQSRGAGSSRPASSMSNQNAPLMHTAQRAAQRPASSQGFLQPLPSRARSPSSREPSPEPSDVPVTFLSAHDMVQARTGPAVPLPPALRRGKPSPRVTQAYFAPHNSGKLQAENDLRSMSKSLVAEDDSDGDEVSPLHGATVADDCLFNLEAARLVRQTSLTRGPRRKTDTCASLTLAQLRHTDQEDEELGLTMQKSLTEPRSRPIMHSQYERSESPAPQHAGSGDVGEY